MVAVAGMVAGFAHDIGSPHGDGVARDGQRRIPPAVGHRQFLTPADVAILAEEEIASEAGAVMFSPAAQPAGNGSAMVASFAPFKPGVRFFWDASSFYVESDSMPDAALMPNIMVGITAWQQQIPIPVGYFGNVTNPENDPLSLGFGQPNLWKLPLVPVPAASPIAISSGNFQRGAIALAANGIPIFNPRNNTGRVSYEIGELDAYGGHCGRADDYHYHIAPTHLSAVLGNGRPVAWALDGYAIYGYLEPDGGAQQALDTDGGHDIGGAWGYHYHARGSPAAGPQAPYLMNAFHGTVMNYGGQVDGQPEAGPVTPAGAPLAGAVITGFSRPATDQYRLIYSVGGSNYTVAWQVDRVAHTVAIQHQTPTGTSNGVFTSAARFNYYPMAAASLLQLPDTGQTLDATTLFGEDSDYTSNPPSFTDHGDGTITDNVTGLMWQKTDGGEMTWDAARTNAPAALGGFNDWRLPTAQEAFSILNHNLNPALDAAYFVNHPGGTPGYFWTSDQFYGDNTKVWAINSGGGLGPHPKSATVSAGGALRFHARYMRGAPPTTGHNYCNNNDGTITDLDTGLMWAQTPSSSLSWSNALAYGESLTLAGFTDWRVPNVKELQSLVDITRATASTAAGAVACLNRTLFPAAASTACWTATSVKSATLAQAWLVEFGVNNASTPARNQQGIVSYEPYASTYPVFAVRGPVSAIVATQIGIEQPAGVPLSDGGSTVNFGSIPVGTGAARTFLITNRGVSTLTITGVTIDGLNATNFSITTAPAGTLAPGASTTMLVQFNATFAGPSPAVLHVASSDPAVTGAFNIGLLALGTIAPPTITGVATSPNTPTSADEVDVTARIQAASGAAITQAQLTYDTGAQTTGTVFAETMAAAAVTLWTGTNADHLWTIVSLAQPNAVRQTTAANHGTSNPCGLEFNKGSTNLSDTFVTTTDAINAAGTSGYVEFWMFTADLIPSNGWTFQLSTNGGVTWTTRLSELTGANHAYQQYHYDLLASERTGTLKMRFQFTGYNAAAPTRPPRANLDDLKIVTTVGAPPVTLAMFDDGQHGDGLAGDGIFGARIPALPAGTTVTCRVTVTDSNGGTNSSAPVAYTVSGTTPGTNLTATAAFAGTDVVLQWNAQATLNYSVQWSGDLINWNNFFVGPTNRWIDAGARGLATKRFYRVKR